MTELNKQDYARINNKVAKMYRDTLKDLLETLKPWSENFDAMTFSQKREFERELKVATHLLKVSKELNKDVAFDIKEYLRKAGSDAYSGLSKALNENGSITIDNVFINPEFLDASLNKPVAGATLSTRLHNDTEKLAKRSTSVIRTGLVKGQSYSSIAGRLRDLNEASYNNAMRIVRTEGHRIQAEATQKGYEDAKVLGIHLRKEWVASIDGRTRHDHAKLNGQTVEIDEKFEVNGHKTMGPGLFGIPEEDINCRCTTVEVLVDEKDMPLPDDPNALTWNEKQAIERYISPQSLSLNDMLRLNLDLNEDYKRWTKNLDAALDKLPNAKGVYNRSAYFRSDDDLRKFVTESTPGNTFTLKGYTSATQYPEIYGKDAALQIRVTNGSTAKDMRYYNEREGELLYKRDARFKSVNVYKEDGMWILEVEELDAK